MLLILPFGAMLLMPVVSKAQDGQPHSIEAQSKRGFYMRHANSLGFVNQINNELDSKDATFRMVRGLAGDCVSFESVNFPGHYLRHSSFRLILSKKVPNETLFDQDATFCMEYGLGQGGQDHGTVSFQSYNFKGRYIRHRDLELWVDAREENPRFLADATFIIVPPRKPPSTL
jgi:hypothetical protein